MLLVRLQSLGKILLFLQFGLGIKKMQKDKQQKCSQCLFPKPSILSAHLLPSHRVKRERILPKPRDGSANNLIKLPLI